MSSSPAPAPAGALQRSPSLRSTAEEDGLRRALEIVRAQGEHFKSDGMSPANFFVGLMNVGVSAFMLGRCPEYYWVYASVKSVAMNLVSLRLKMKAHQRLYLFDLCHVMSFSYTLATTAALVALLHHPTRVTLSAFTSRPAVFRAVFALANGPLGFAVPTLANALVLHSAKQTAALFIHISPPLVTWAMRWHAAEHEAAFPGLLPAPYRPRDVDASYAELVLPALRLYAAWWVVFTTWMLAHGRHHGHRNASGSTHDTVYHATLGGKKPGTATSPVGNALGYDPARPAALGPLMRYLFAHAAVCAGLVALSPAFWRSFWAHTLFVLALLACSVWNGARRYFWMMSKAYEGRLRALLPEGDQEDKKRR